MSGELSALYYDNIAVPDYIESRCSTIGSGGSTLRVQIIDTTRLSDPIQDVHCSMSILRSLFKHNVESSVSVIQRSRCMQLHVVKRGTKGSSIIFGENGGVQYRGLDTDICNVY